MPRPTLNELAQTVETSLGFNLVWLSDRLDQEVRQGDTETLRRLEELNQGWLAAVRLLTRLQTEHPEL